MAANDEGGVTSTELVVPGIGAVVNLEDSAQVAIALDDVRNLEYQLKAVKTDLTRALVHASSVQGTKTLHLPGATVTIKSGVEYEYDAEEIEIGLRAAGMPEKRIREIVKETVNYKVDAAKAKQAGGANEAYGEVIEAGRRKIEKPPSASISRKATS